MAKAKFLDQFRVRPGEKVKLKDYPTDWADTKGVKKLGEDEAKARALEILGENQKELMNAQDLLYADNRNSLLVVLQAMDAAGKDGTIKHVMSGVNPQGCQVFGFKQPSAEELDHDFLWRYAKALPERGRIGIFNRSYYEDVLVVKVHPELLAAGKWPPGKPDKAFWKDRYDDINAFERHLARNGTKVLKFFLHLSKGEQKKRFLARLDDPEKHWKFSLSDMAERAFWDDYADAYEDCLSATSTDDAPWYVVPADQKWFTRAVVASVLAAGIRSLDLSFPKVTDEARDRLAKARAELVGE